MTGFYVKCNTGLKLIKHYSKTAAATLTFISCFEEPLLVVKINSAQFVCCCDNL